MKRNGLLTRFAHRFRRDDGNATIEFVILFPAILMLFLSAFEVGIFLTRSVLLDRALDLNVRALRLGHLNPATHDELKRRVCEDSLIFQDCPNAVSLELRPISNSSWDLPMGRIPCVDRNEDIQPAVEFNTGGDNEIMLVRACAVLDPFFGTTPFVINLPRDESGGMAIASMSTFVNEP
ncbi:TadE/TadG family type IV pilus assembly protein [Aliiroseovarius subalbicans]|uniref:TadE/TadG family type IV pilus assembly protein n=1 Tax=Aliiroseovarius subalbicans TaxID=2925840 RepID=UPI001F577995|nr:TadE/TadG family type IV pilus assembly protein [Aliiroseovarius subalbicans]MCI2398072.1 pilus assembly protein [Aliiroseovarius subalbicans]